MIRNCEQRIAIEFYSYRQPIPMRDFCLACNSALIESHRYPEAQILPPGLRVYNIEPDPHAFIYFEPDSETTWGNLECTINGLRRFMQRW